jgi:hypothetical protein
MSEEPKGAFIKTIVCPVDHDKFEANIPSTPSPEREKIIAYEICPRGHRYRIVRYSDGSWTVWEGWKD